VNQHSSKQQIFQDIYQENLYVSGRISRPVAVEKSAKTRALSKPKSPLMFFWSLIVAGVIAYVGLIAYWHQSRQNQSILVGAELTRFPENESIIHMPTAFIEPSSTDISSDSIAEILPDEIGDAILGLYENDAKKLPILADRETLNDAEALIKGRQPLARLFGLGVGTIVIDPGHGGKDPGAIGRLKTKEKDIALAIALRLRERLVKRDGYKVLMTRESDHAVSLSDRVSYANTVNADLFISIHINFFPTVKQNFVETYYFGTKTDAVTVSLAARENANSEYVYADFKNMIRKIGDTMKFQESKELASSVQNSLFSNMYKLNNKIKNHGIKPGPFVVLLGLDAPSILAEVTSLNNKQEEQHLKSKKYRDKIAMFLEKGIVNYLNRETTVGDLGNGKEKEKLSKAR
jgi:N-acetylmuramoyl-L-alanine amidase